ncbi:hypothetical protein COEREDRAFT_80031 [Coemansia reversa NRRL 1564]|uniref:TPR-like protein n=1 Tax=Coemansia reversa (strain ATCC 12441 / NRRL 1564) TaxID=763665 RepID=A0A2G5BGE4_COERN|nr:hypothetical protein COEREDRAFT_80031 [Coemansia reversa NRRL 1564]|eukprot:PIA18080.1 hypothetical protein COEREDRAFT_80031 [Coemansia reversa NRRL 1564]
MPGNDSSAPKRKRPLGLKARAAKKSNNMADSTASTSEVKDFDEANTATIMLRGDEGDEIDELEGIFDSAIEAINSEDERALTLLRGTIHESDRILRLYDSDGKTPEARFYYIYGTALFNFSEILEAEEEESTMYLELALHRLTQARDQMGDEPFAWRVYLMLAKAGLELAAESNAEVDRVEMALQVLDRALQTLEKQQNNEPPTEETPSVRIEALAAADMVLSLADSQRLPETSSVRLVQWGEASARKQHTNQADSESSLVIARALWLRASALVVDDEEDEVKEKELYTKLLTEAQSLLEKDGKEKPSSDALLLLGEVQLNLGNVQQDEDRQEELYKQAVATFRQVQSRGELPDQFAQFIDDFENQSDSDEDSN